MTNRKTNYKFHPLTLEQNIHFWDRKKIRLVRHLKRMTMKNGQLVTQNKNNCLTKYPLTLKLKGGQCVSVLGSLPPIIMRIFFTIFIISLIIGCSEKGTGDWRQEFIDQEKSRIVTIVRFYDFDSVKYVLRDIDSSFKTYNEKGQLLGVNNRSFCRYDSTGKLIEEIYCMRDCENPSRDLYFYDTLNRLKRTLIVVSEERVLILKQYFYNDKNLLIKEVFGNDSTPKTITYTYDSLSRRTTETKHEFNDNVNKWITYVDSLFYDKNDNVILKKRREIGKDLLTISKLTYKDSLLVTRVDTTITTISTYLPTPSTVHHAYYFREDYKYNSDNKLIERTIFQPDYKTPYCKLTYEYKE